MLKIKKDLFVYTGLVFLVSIFGFILATNLSPSNALRTIHSAYDIRLNGLTALGTSTPDFSFQERRVAAGLARVRLKFESNEETKKNSPQFEFFINDISVAKEDVEKNNTITLQIPRDNIFASFTQKHEGLKLEAKCLNPVSNPETGALVCARLYSLEILPRFLVIFPSLTFGIEGTLCFFAILGALTLCLWGKLARPKIIAANIVTAIVSAIYLASNRYDYWDRMVWFEVFFLLIIAGLSIGLKIGKAEIPLKTSAKTNLLLLVVILLSAFYIRFDSLDFGLPYFFHPDEGRKMKIVQNMVATGDMNPHYFRHPNFLLYGGAFLNYIFKLIYGYVPELQVVTYLTRSVSAILGSLTVLVIFGITRLIYGQRPALIAALLTSFSPLLVVSSRYIKEDACMLFFCLLSLYFAIKAVKDHRIYLNTGLSAFFAGVSTSSKYSGLLSILFAGLPILNLSLIHLRKITGLKFIDYISHAQSKNEITLKTFVILVPLVMVLPVVGFLMFTPYALLDHELFIYDFIGEKNHMEKGHSVAITALSFYWSYHFKYSLIPALKYPLALTSIVALGYLLTKVNAFSFLIVGCFFLFYLPAEWVNAKPEPQPERYIIPCIPFLIIAVSALFSDLMAYFSRKDKIIYLLATSAFIFSFAYMLQYTYSHNQSIKNDTRLQAREWVLNNIPQKSKVILDWEFYSPPILDADYEVYQLKSKINNKILKSLSKDGLEKSGYDYYIASSFFYGRYRNNLYRSHNLSKRFKDVFENMQIVETFDAGRYRYGFHNPSITIFKIK